ncbi:DUF485 domain-containing protein [Streptomyces sp. NPDC005648]|uniref:DUF485 domain-containing protein n=1 Tax=Streptomyces sp. NPDC005648 TaxID=3157044 RepID=UPI0033A5104E
MSVPPRRSGNEPTDDHPLDADAGPLHELHRTHRRARRRFLVLNGAVFLVTALLSGTADELFAGGPGNGMPLGAPLGALQLTVLLLTSWWYDRALRRHADPLADRIRRSAEHLPHASQLYPGPATGRQR